MPGLFLPALVLAAGGGGWLDYMHEQTGMSGAGGASCELVRLPAGAECGNGVVPVEMREIAGASDHLLQSNAGYELVGGGDGENGLAGLPASSASVNCTNVFDTMFGSIAGRDEECVACRERAPSRYFPGMENSFFGRVHFYETQWRPNIVNRGLARDVTSCVPAESRRACAAGGPGAREETYRFGVDDRDWDALMARQFKGTSRGRLFLAHWRDPAQGRAYAAGITQAGCAEAYDLYRGVRHDWPHAPAAPGMLADAESACENADSRRRLGEEYARLLEEVVAQTKSGLRERPVRADVPCLGFGSGSNAFDPERDLPAAWRHEGVVLFVGLVTRDPKWTRNELAVGHQGMLIFRDGHWWFRHASRDEKKYVEVRFDNYLRGSSFVGMNLLAPQAPVSGP